MRKTASLIGGALVLAVAAVAASDAAHPQQQQQEASEQGECTATLEVKEKSGQ